MFVLIVAKEPVPGRVKTRLCPPCTPAQAAGLARAALADTLDTALASRADQVIVALDGSPGPWLPADTTVIPQSDGSFDRRLARAWADALAVVDGPGLQIGMDTPQLTAADLDAAMTCLADPTVDAVLGPATDGGWWSIGLPRTADPAAVFHDIPMSSSSTGSTQHERLRALALDVALLGPMTDVDDIDDARLVAATAPHSRFAAAFDDTMREPAPS